tara:strand:- start:50 stop:1774 length:1725 start_codon:yes stop_codon:yes gene_type:complete
MTAKVYLFQPQSTVVIKGKKQYWLPYSAACIWSYANKHVDGFELGEIFFRREYPEKVLERIKDPVLCGFSCYVWNEQYNLHLAKLIKEKYPDCVIEFGGPQAQRHLIEKDFIDTVLLGYGEIAFADVLSRIKNACKLIPVYEREQPKELAYVSPYTNGVMDKIIDDNPEYQWATLVESTRGCPHHCTFCDWGTWMDLIQKFDMDVVKKDIMWMSTHKIGFLMMADANFGIFRDRDLQIAKWLREAADHPDAIVDDLTVQYTKNKTDVVLDITETLGSYDRRGVTMSVQSMSQPVLKAIKRKNMDVNRISDVVDKARKRNLNVYTEMILGLPEETVDSWKDGMCLLMETGQDSLDVWLCQLFGQTEMNMNREKHGIKVVNAEDYVSFTKHDSEDYPIKEVIEIVNETDTMTTDDIIESYLFAWVVIMFHINGFSHYISTFHDYRKFYDNLKDYLDSDSGIFGQHFKGLKERISAYLRTGKVISDKDTGHTLELNVGTDFDLFWDNKDLAFKLVEESCNPSEDIMEIQRKLLYDPKVNYPIKVQDYKIWNPRPIEERDDIWTIKRKNMLKNKLTKV